MTRAISLILLLVLCTAASTAEERLGFKLEQGYLITVRCSIGNLDNLTAIVDTGASETVVDISVVRHLNLPITADRAVFLTREMKVFAVSIPSLRLGQVMTGPLAGVAADLHSLTSQSRIRPDVLIGMDVLGQKNLMIDYRRRQLLFTSEPISLANQVPLAGSPRLAVVQARVNGNSLSLHLDTGAKGILVYEPRGKTVALRGPSTQVASLADHFVADSREVGQMELGRFVISKPEILVIKENSPAGIDGLFGPCSLHARRVAIDFSNRTMSWE